MAAYTVLVLLIFFCAVVSVAEQDCFSRDAMAEIQQEIQSCINNAFQSSINESVSSPTPPPPGDLSGYCWVQNPAKNGQYCFSGDQWNAMQDDMYTHIYAKLLKSFNVTREVNQKVQQLQDRLFQQIYSQVMRELNATQEELHQTLDTTREVLLRKINTTQDNLQQEYLRLSKQVPATSCKEIAENDPRSSSGYYKVWNSNGTAVQVYCDMDRVCGCNATGGWTRIAFLNMTDPNQQCPQAWREVSSPKRTCRRTSSRCESEYFNTYSINYTRVCGRVVAYQYGHTDAFGPYINRQAPPNTIESAYIDGVSITHGQSPRHHIWTFASAIIKVFGSGIQDHDICACTDTRRNWPYTTPSWVGNDYFCDSSNPGPGYDGDTTYSGDPLWDGQGCPSTSTCCQFNNPPWFCKQLPQAMADSIEVRICGADGVGHIGLSNEDLLVELIELYIQ